MDQRQLRSAGALYPYSHPQGLYGIPFGMALALVGLSNLHRPPAGTWLVIAGVVSTLAALAGVTRYYRVNFGRVTPMRSRQTRCLVAAVTGFAVYIGLDQLGRALLGRPPEEPVSTTAAAWAVGMLVFYAIAAGLRVHHVAVWAVVFVAGVLPIWGTGVDREAVAYFPIAAATMVAGLFDHRSLVLTFRSYRDLDLRDGHDGA
ncbi:hypothetical protein AB0I28_38765 [Phytomonospora sp. NPDC050363]|uniref:hypothetical protein n=1 Tax=Phytomonospora sp. NPDC050363 TaxID=3155642 RepID=UPI0033D88B98